MPTTDLPTPDTFSTEDYDFFDDYCDFLQNLHDPAADSAYENCPEGWENWGRSSDDGGWDMPDSWYD